MLLKSALTASLQANGVLNVSEFIKEWSRNFGDVGGL